MFLTKLQIRGLSNKYSRKEVIYLKPTHIFQAATTTIIDITDHRNIRKRAVDELRVMEAKE